MLPEKFTERMRELLGEEAESFFESLTLEQDRALRLNPGKLKGAPEELPFALEPVSWAENGFYYEAADRPGKHPFHEAGVYYIQEPSAMLPAKLLDARPGERVLDLCAAPGGKSTQIASAMKGKGLLVANETHPARAKILSENVERMGIANCLVLNETPERLAKEYSGFFDRILVDAPCSGEGMFRKNGEAAAEWSPENVQRCASRQDGILDSAAELLRAGGRIVYSTCTFAPEENEGTIARFLMRHPEFHIERVPDGEAGGIFCSGRPEWAMDAGGKALACGGDIQQALACTVRLWPHKIRGEGHFAAVLQKAGVWTDRESYGAEKGIAKKDCPEYLAFESENLNGPVEKLFPGRFLKFGEQLYLVPEGMPSIRGLKVLRPGLHLGTAKKNRFEPSHALALALKPSHAKRVYELAADGQEIRDYLSGMTFPAAGENGWYLITTGGYSCGWGKLAGGMMKNHYPKGLRKNCL